MTNDDKNASRSNVEKHVQTIAIAAVLGFLGWNTNTLLDMKDRQTRQETLMQGLIGQIATLNLDRYTGTDHRRYETEIDRRLSEMTRRIDENSRNLEELRYGRKK